MDLDLQRTTIDGYRLAMDLILSQEETAESIVPDSYPDISRIISTSAMAFLTAKQLNRGSLKVMGTIQVCVLYIPDGDSSPKSLRIKIPFQCAGNDPKVNEEQFFHSFVMSVDTDARILNPRKLFIKAEVKLGIHVYARETSAITSDLAISDDHFQKLYKEIRHHTISGILEKPFFFSDTLRIPQSKPELEDLLNYGVSSSTVEARYIGKKLICKGELSLSVLYRSGSGIHIGNFELPFSQILEIESRFDEGDADVNIYLKNIECELRDGELDVSVEAVLQACLWSGGDITLLHDVYSTATALDIERSAGEFCTARELELHRESVRKLCESGIPAKQVVMCTSSLIPSISQTLGPDAEVKAEALIRILYLTEDDALCMVEYKIPVKWEYAASENCQYSGNCIIAGDVVAVPVTGGFEVRFEVEFHLLTMQLEKMPFVTDVKMVEEPVDCSPVPSVVIRMVSPGETLWEIAKSCKSTIKEICMANGLDSEAEIAGKVLLIPAKR